jgi:DNA-binding PadR family transcriptional regulator
MDEHELSTNSHFLLALLGLGAWSAYELAEQMKRGFQYIWPRAERAFYYEAKRLAEHGFARAVDSPVGGRPRVMYTITPKGLDALTRWLADREPEPTRLESEVLGRLFFSEYGTIDDLRAAAAAVVADGAAVLEVVQRRSRVYLGQGTEFPQRFHMIAIAGRFLADYGLMLTRYGSWVLDLTAEWRDTGADGKTAAALEIFAGIERESTAELDRISRRHPHR